MVSNLSTSLVGVLYNVQLMAIAKENGVNAYGVLMYVSFIFMAFFFGYSIAVTPVVGYHYGAQNHAELKSLLRKSLIITALVSLVMTGASVTLAGPIADLFVGYDAALLIGYHTRKGSKGVISHSYAYGSMVEMRINGKIASEYELIGYMIGYYGVPVVFLSGDDIITADARANVPGIHTVETKRCISNGAAACLHPNVTGRRIREEVKAALLNLKAEGIAPMQLEGPVTIDVRYTAEAQAWKAMQAPGTIRLDEATVRYLGEDYKEAFTAFLAGTTLAGTFRDDADLYC